MGLHAKKSFHAVSLHTKASSLGVPDDGELALINQFTVREHSADEIYARTMVIAHNGIDRDREVIADDLLDMFAETLPGKGFFVKHPLSWDGDTAPGEGRFFHAETKRVSLDEARKILREPDLKFLDGTTEAVLFEASFYTVTKHREKLIADIDAGIAGDVSLGFSYGDKQPQYDDNENIIADLLVGPGKAYEGSLVWLGAQPGARITKNANREENDMELKDALKKIDDLETKNATLSTDIGALKTKAAGYDSAKAVLGDSVDDAGALETLKANADLGVARRTELVNETIKAERLGGLIEDTDDAVKAATKEYEGLPLDRLKMYHRKALAALPEGSQLDGGDANTNKTGKEAPTDKTKGADESSPFNNKAVTG